MKLSGFAFRLDTLFKSNGVTLLSSLFSPLCLAKSSFCCCCISLAICDQCAPVSVFPLPSSVISTSFAVGFTVRVLSIFVSLSVIAATATDDELPGSAMSFASACFASSLSSHAFTATFTAASCLYNAKDSCFLVSDSSFLRWKSSKLKESHADWKDANIVGIEEYSGFVTTAEDVVDSVDVDVVVMGMISSVVMASFVIGSVPWVEMYVVNASLSKILWDLKDNTGCGVGEFVRLQMSIVEMSVVLFLLIAEGFRLIMKLCCVNEASNAESRKC